MHRQTYIFAVVAAAVAVLGAFVFLADDRTAVEVRSGRIDVVASFYPLAEFAAKVGGNMVAVSNITPAGTEPHDFEPTPRQVASIYGSHLFVYNGGGVDVWASRLAGAIGERGVKTLEMRPLMGELLPPVDQEEGEMFDEHFWLDPVLAQRQVEAIRDALAGIDPAHAAEYRDRADSYVAELRSLDADFRRGLASCQIREAITSHAAFAYLARRYGFTQLAIAGLSPDEEPSAGALAALVREAERRGIRHVFFETLASPEMAETLAREIGAQTLVFNPLEGLTGEELVTGKNYLTVMRQNLANLRTAMVCP
ncbi:zinc ABC transporter substrate-binding protein [Candidatus Uhrbacteria bacterium]|nr:zinc ABC transporter substrate-binding protein [Candidatus Uhrbacteria bacterium]